MTTRSASADRDPWFVVQLKPHGLRMARTHLARQNFRTFSPSLAPSQGKKAPRPAFPGYLFVTFDPTQGAWAKINSTRGVSRLIASGSRHPSPLPVDFMAALWARTDEAEMLCPPEDLKCGDDIRVITGPFEGTIARIQGLPDASRVAILLELMGRQVRTTLPRNSLERIHAA